MPNFLISNYLILIIDLFYPIVYQFRFLHKHYFFLVLLYFQEIRKKYMENAAEIV